MPDRKAELEKLIPEGCNVVFHNGTTDDEYIDLLNGAAALATGSKVEGFGLPIVEAQTLGTPVILNDLEIFHEVAADGALFFTADNEKQFAELVLKLNNPDLFKDLVEKGHKQAANFAWSKSAQALYEVCEKLVANKP